MPSKKSSDVARNYIANISACRKIDTGLGGARVYAYHLLTYSVFGVSFVGMRIESNMFYKKPAKLVFFIAFYSMVAECLLSCFGSLCLGVPCLSTRP